LATAVLLLVNERFKPPVGAAADSVTVPCTLPPAAMLLAFSATAVMPVEVDVAAVDEPPHWTVVKMRTAVATSAASWIVCLENGFMHR
jgi:hypothetical protein